MKKRTKALALVLVGAPALLSGCGNDDCDPRTDEGCTNGSGTTGYHGGYRGGGGSSFGRSTRGGFGSIGRGIFSGG